MCIYNGSEFMCTVAGCLCLGEYLFLCASVCVFVCVSVSVYLFCLCLGVFVCVFVCAGNHSRGLNACRVKTNELPQRPEEEREVGRDRRKSRPR